MTTAAASVASIRNTYLALVTGNTLAASFIWGINTIFLLEAGLSNFEAFAANAFFTVGMVLFEVPTGVIADTRGRRTSYLLGCGTLMLSTLFYVLLASLSAPFWAWAAASLLLGLGFTFFSGAQEAWLVDALHGVGYKGELESMFAKGQVAGGVAMLTGSVLGGVTAQFWSLSAPYWIRAGLLAITGLIAWRYMRDIGFTPRRSARPMHDVRMLLRRSLDGGLKNPPVRWLMLAAPLTGGVGIYVFYAMQPYLLGLYGDDTAYVVAGLVAAIVAASQIAGGLAAKYIRTLFKRRTTALIFGLSLSVTALALSGFADNFWVVLGLILVWGLVSAGTVPIRQALLNNLIPSQERATILSFDSLMASSGGIIIQPAFGRAADVYGYASSYAMSAAVQALALPLLLKAWAENTPADYHHTTTPPPKT